MEADTKEQFASLNSEDLEKILTEKDSKLPNGAQKLLWNSSKCILENELPEKFEAASAWTLHDSS